MFKSIIFIFLFFVFGCNVNSKHAEKKVERSFYYWKSVFNLSDFEKQRADSLHATCIYLKFFDVDWNATIQQPTPVAQVSIEDTGYLQTKKIIPVVFITNQCIFKLDSLQAAPLAEKIYKLLHQIILINNIKNVSEIQIDCDWTASTKEKYFSILRKLKLLINPWDISATIRLHQIKFFSGMGIPPVDRGLLMCYNMGDLKKPSTKNSIIETAELKKYIGTLSKYPLPLDVALPLFEWKVLFRNENYIGLIQNLPDNILQQSVAEKNDNRFIIKKDTLLAGYDLKAGDILRNEKSDYDEIMASASAINRQLSHDTFRVSLYHLDSLTLRKYSYDEMENIFSSFH
jgi:hypothetical protein